MSDLQLYGLYLVFLGGFITLGLLFFLFGYDHARTTQARKDAAAAQRIRDAIRSHEEPLVAVGVDYDGRIREISDLSPTRFVPLAAAPSESIVCQPDGRE